MKNELSPRRHWPLVLLLLLLAQNIYWFLIAGGSPPAIGTQAHERAVLSELRELSAAQAQTVALLEDLQSAWLSQAERAPQRAALGGDPVPFVPQDWDVLQGSLGALTKALEQQLAQGEAWLQRMQTPEGASESLFALKRRRHDNDWNALEQLRELWSTDEPAASRSQYFLTPRELLEAYGPPTAIYSPKSGTLYHYRRLPEDTPGPSWYFKALEGSVIEFWIEEKTPGAD